MKYRSNKFDGYTLEDCACEYCLHYAEGQPCPPDTCCCADEKQEAVLRQPSSKPPMSADKAWTASVSCRV